MPAVLLLGIVSVLVSRADVNQHLWTGCSSDAAHGLQMPAAQPSSPAQPRLSACSPTCPSSGIVERPVVKASADWFVTSLDALRDALPRYRVAMIGSGAPAGLCEVNGGRVRCRCWQAVRQVWLQRAIQDACIDACIQPPFSKPNAWHAAFWLLAGAWACTAVKMIAENLRR